MPKHKAQPANVRTPPSGLSPASPSEPAAPENVAVSPVHSVPPGELFQTNMSTQNLGNMSVSDLRDLTSNVPCVDGTDLEALLKFILEVDSVMSIPIVPYNLINKILVFKTEGSLRTWWIQQVNSQSVWSVQKKLLLDYFMSPIDRAMMVERFVNRKQGRTEGFPEFVEDVLKYINLLNVPFAEIDLVAKLWVNQNLHSFNYFQFREPPTSMDGLRNLIQQFRGVERQRRSYGNDPRGQSVAINCRYCRQDGHHISRCPVRPPPPSPQVTPRAILPEDR